MLAIDLALKLEVHSRFTQMVYNWNDNLWGANCVDCGVSDVFVFFLIHSLGLTWCLVPGSSSCYYNIIIKSIYSFIHSFKQQMVTGCLLSTTKLAGY